MKEPSSGKGSPLRRFLSVVTQVVSWAVAIALGAAILATVLIPRLIDAEPYTVMSGSMEPTLPTGSVVVSQSVSTDAVRFDDIITFQMESGRPQTVTHRVVAVDVVEGETRLRTQGDANNAIDPEPIRPEQVRGKVIYHIPYVGYLGRIIPPTMREPLVTIVGVGLLIYAAILIVRIILDRPRKETPESS